MANQVDFKILPSDQFNVYSPQTRSDKIITYFTLLSKLRGDILAVGQDEDPNDIVSAYYSNVGGTQTLHLVKADGSEITASQAQQVISGTLNYVSKFTSSNDIGNSQIFDDGTNVGIGTTSMTHKLQLGTGGVFADYFQLDTTYSNGFVVGAISWDQDNGTADVGLSGSLKLKVGQDDVWYVKNQTGSTITKGTAVYASGTLGASSRITVAPMIADGTIPARFFLGIVAETIANGADGYVLARGKIRQISTLAYNEGDVLWVSPTTAGALTATEPTAPNLKLPVAFVVYKASNGVLAVRATTGTKIYDASDVDYFGASDNSFLVYNSVTGVWEDEAVGIFKTIAVSGQSDVVADTYDDTLTLTAGTGVTITTDAATDTITISAPGATGGTVTSIDITAGPKILSIGGPITTSGSITVSHEGTTPSDLVTMTDFINYVVANGGTVEAVGPVGEVLAPLTGYTVQPSTSNSGGTVLQNIAVDAYGHVNGVGSITLDTDDIAEGSTNLYFTNARAQAAIAAFSTIAVSGQSNVVADAYNDTLTFATSGSGFTITTDASTDTITFTNTLPDQTVSLTASTGITVTGTYPSFTIENSDRGSSQDIFKTIAVTGQSNIVADSNSDTLNIEAGSGVSISTNASTDTITISATGSGGTVTSVAIANGGGLDVTGSPITSSGTITIENTDRGSAQNIFKNFAVTGSSTIVADNNDDTVTFEAGTGITLAGNASSDTITITNSAPDQTVVLTAGTGISTSGTYPSFTITNTAPDQVVSLTGAGTTSISGSYPSFTITSNDQFTGTVTSVDLTAGAKIGVSGGPITTSGSITVEHLATEPADLPTMTSFIAYVQANGGVVEAVGPVGQVLATLTGATVATSTSNTGGTVLQNVAIDDYGHVFGVSSVTLDTDDIVEGSTNLYYTDARSRAALSAGTGISYDSSTGVITNSSPDQTVVLTGTGTTTITGTYPSFTINSDDQYDGTVTSINLTAGDRIEVSGGPVTSSGSITVTHGTATGADFTTAEAFRDRVIADGGTFEALGEVAIAIGSLDDAASPTSTDYSDGVVLQNLAVDEFGHVLGVGATDLDERYVQNLTAGTGITVSGSPSSTAGLITVTNSDTGSAQNIFKNIAVSGQSTIVADSNNDTLTVVAGTGISITTSAATDTLTITNTGTPSLALANSINYAPLSSAFWYPVTGSYATIVMDTTNRARLAAPISVDDANRILATVTLEVANTGSAGFCTMGVQLYNNTHGVPVAKSIHTWTAYLDANLQDSSYTLFTLHFPIDDTDVNYGDKIDVQVISIASTQEIMAFRYSLVAVTAA